MKMPVRSILAFLLAGVGATAISGAARIVAASKRFLRVTELVMFIISSLGRERFWLRIRPRHRDCVSYRIRDQGEPPAGRFCFRLAEERRSDQGPDYSLHSHRDVAPAAPETTQAGVRTG